MPATFRSFAERNYRLFFAGALISNVGTWMSRVAQDWLVLVELTDHDATALGLVTGLQFLPMLLLAPFAGVVADRFPKIRVLTATNLAMCLTSVLLAALVMTGVAQLWHVYALALAQGLAAAVDGPTRQAFVSEIVSPDNLSNAVGLNSASFNAARIVGPGVAGLMIAGVGTGPVFAVNAVSFLGYLGVIALMDRALLHPAPAARGRGRLVEGLRYVRSRPDIVLLLVIVFMYGTFAMNFQMTTALMATMVYGKGPAEYGLLGSIMAVGSLSAAIWVASRARPRLRVVLGALAAYTLLSTALALAPTYEAFAALLIPVGFTALTVLPTCNALVQLSAAPQMRGRVLALYMAIFFGGTPLGAPMIGWIGEHWGPRWTILVGSIATGVTFLAASAYVLRAGDLHVRYQRRRPFVYLERGGPVINPIPDDTR